MTINAEQPIESTAINVLLVDDNEQWVNFLRDDLERQDDGLSVSIALSANEAMVALADDDIDVVVADYRMPEVDGLQLLERIREERPHFPFILVTAAGSEEVAATAIESGVSDYLVKNSNAEQTPLLAQRIRATFEQFQLRRRLRHSEQRYRTVAERSHDGIAIVQRGQVRYHNERLAEWAGYDPGELDGLDFVDTLIHRDDRSRIRDILDADEQSGSLLEARLRSAGEHARYGEFAWAAIDHDGDPAVLVSIRDVTERRRREDRINRERRLNRGIFDALAESATRSEIEKLVVCEFTDHGYNLAWIGEPDGEGVIPRAKNDRTDYLSTVTVNGKIEAPGEPAVIAARTGDPRFVADVHELLESNWRDAVCNTDVRSVAALPVTYDGVRYGVLGVYHPAPDHFDEIERELLGEAARTLGFAVHHVETRRALGSDEAVTVDLSLAADASPLAQVLSDPTFDASRVQVTVEGTHAGPDGRSIQYLMVEGASIEELSNALRQVPRFQDVIVIDRQGPSRLQVTSTERPVEALLADRGARIDRSVVTPDGTTIRLTIGDRMAVTDVVEAIKDRYGNVEIESITDAVRPATAITHAIDLDRLTDKQVAALAAAHQHGYFEQPRGSSATDIAAALEVTHSTYLQHLRAAQRKLTTQLFDGSDIQ